MEKVCESYAPAIFRIKGGKKKWAGCLLKVSEVTANKQVGQPRKGGDTTRTEAAENDD